MHGSFSPVSMDTGLLLLIVLGYLAMVRGCPRECQCNLDYFVFCSGISLDEGEQLRRIMSEVPQKARLLDLSFNRLTELPPGIFSDLPELQTLNLQSNKIANVPAHAFHNLPKLGELNLSGNAIYQVTGGAWEKIPSLRVLDLEHNYIDHIEEGSFRPLSNLTDLSLRNNQIGVLESRTLAGLTSLHSLDVSHNIIQRVDNGSFQDLGQLVTLDLSYNMVGEVHSGIFSGLSKMDTLILDYNRVNDLQYIALASFRLTLKKLHVSHNELTAVPAGLFNNFHLLSELCLDHNQIQTIARSPFIGMSLDKLSISHNKLTGLQRDMFGQIQRIRYLDFSFNKIRTLSTGVFDSFRETVYKVRLEGNRLLYIDAGHFRGMIRVRCLNLSDNLISIIKDDSFGDLRDLEDLVLSGNDLKKVTPAMLSGIRLARLYLICNPLRWFSGFRYDEGNGEEGSGPRRVHMNLTVLDQTDTSVHVRWPYSQGSQIYWTLRLKCLSVSWLEEKCSSSSSREEYLAPFKSEHTVEDLLPNMEYYLCIDPQFVNRDVRVEQCIFISSQSRRSTTDSDIRVTDSLTSTGGQSVHPDERLGLLVALTVLLISSCCVTQTH